MGLEPIRYHYRRIFLLHYVLPQPSNDVVVWTMFSPYYKLRWVVYSLYTFVLARRCLTFHRISHLHLYSFPYKALLLRSLGKSPLRLPISPHAHILFIKSNYQSTYTSSIPLGQPVSYTLPNRPNGVSTTVYGDKSFDARMI